MLAGAGLGKGRAVLGDTGQVPERFLTEAHLPVSPPPPAGAPSPFPSSQGTPNHQPSTCTQPVLAAPAALPPSSPDTHSCSAKAVKEDCVTLKTLNHMCQTQGPRAKCVPPGLAMWPAPRCHHCTPLRFHHNDSL
uniref:Uncharacterized protein n=1 Tax=Pipistrellus kuhlii TaxID=59472 RepID=A0A7J7QX51_PIPKU|nr:hypothetical protein mPipKuh1_008222 [Pipistrellus kuhlii]